jgi:membrane associated rhomboid family serine protease
MLPIRDVIPSQTVPIATIGLIALNGLVFLHEFSLVAHSPAALDSFIEIYGFIPAAFTIPTIFSSMFLHGGFMHLFGNMLSLWIFGDNIEDRLGHGRYVFFYLLCGVIAALAHFFSDPSSQIPTVGASGAIAGIMGAYFVLYPRSRVLMWVPIFFLFEVPSVFFLGFWFLTQLLSGVSSGLASSGQVGGVAFWAHVAGFASGAILVKVFARPERSQLEWWDARTRP